MHRALRAVVAPVGAFAGIFLLFHLASSLAMDLLAWSTPLRPDPAWERPFALAGAGVGAVLFATRDARESLSVERLWTFVLVAHLCTYALFVPYFHLVTVREGPAVARAVSVSSPAYHGGGYALFLLALLGAYGLVYRGGLARSREFLSA